MKYRWHIDVVQEFKVGDPCPDGYIDRQEWANVHLKAGLRQKKCGWCLLWKFPHELSSKIIQTKAHTRRGREVIMEHRICLECEAARAAK